MPRVDPTPPSSDSRLLFVSSSTGRRAHALRGNLVELVRELGATTSILTDTGEGHQVRRFLHEQLCDVALRFDDRRVVAAPTRWLGSLHGRRANAAGGGRTDVLTTPAPENAFSDVAVSFLPDVVIATDIAVRPWQTIRHTCRELGLPTVLVVHDDAALAHLEADPLGHDLVLTTSPRLTDAASTLGHPTHPIGYVVDVAPRRWRTSRSEIVVLDPFSDRGLALLPELANTFPTTPFVLQGHAPLGRETHRRASAVLNRCPNVLFRIADDGVDTLADAGLVLVPSADAPSGEINHALAHGIPVIGAFEADYVDLIGAAGVYVAESTGLVGWTDAIAKVWQNPTHYGELERQARARAMRVRTEFRTGVRGAMAKMVSLRDEIRLVP